MLTGIPLTCYNAYSIRRLRFRLNSSESRKFSNIDNKRSAEAYKHQDIGDIRCKDDGTSDVEVVGHAVVGDESTSMPSMMVGDLPAAVWIAWDTFLLVHQRPSRVRAFGFTRA